MFTRSSRHYRGITTSFYSICIVLGTVCVNPLSAVPEFNISGHVGSTAVLPCKLETEDTGTLYIKWQIGSETVFERRGEETYQDVRYKGRVDVPVEELRKGNCSLVLHNLKLTDAAVYRSYQIVRRTKRSVKRKTVALSRVGLSVDDPLSAVPEFTVSGHVGSTAVLPCELQSEDTGTLYIIWQIESETVFERDGEKTDQGEGYKGRVDVPVEDLRKGNCSLVLRNLTRADAADYRSSKIVKHTNKREVISRVYLSVDEKQNEENKSVNEVPRAGGWTGVGVGVVGTIAVIAVIVAVLYWCKRRRNRPVNSEEGVDEFIPVVPGSE